MHKLRRAIKLSLLNLNQRSKWIIDERFLENVRKIKIWRTFKKLNKLKISNKCF